MNANETPALGLSFVVNCSRFACKATHRPQTRSPARAVSYNSCSFTMIATFGARRAPLQKQPAVGRCGDRLWPSFRIVRFYRSHHATETSVQQKGQRLVSPAPCCLEFYWALKLSVNW